MSERASSAAPGAEQEELTPPWPGLLHVPGGLVCVPACALWPAHESVAAPCWLEPEAQPTDPDSNVAPPTVAQLAWAAAAGLIAPPGELEQTCSELALEAASLAEPRMVALATGRGGGVVAEPPPVRARRMISLQEQRPRWLAVARPCVPRHGRGGLWPAVRERPSIPGAAGSEAWLLDVDEAVVAVAEDSGWTLIASTPQEHPLGWVPSDALTALGDGPDEAEADQAEAPSAADTSSWADAEGPESDAPMIDAIVRLARAALARLGERSAGAPEALGDGAAGVPERVAELLEAWASSGLCEDERLAALSATDVILLALIAAPALERSLALGYRALAAPETAVTVGLIADLAGARAATRVRMLRRLGSSQPLRRVDAVMLSAPDELPMAATALTVAPWVVAALYS